MQLVERGFGRRLFNDTVCMEFRVNFTIAKYENDIFSLCGTSNAFIYAFFPHFKLHFIIQDHLNLIKTMLLLFFSRFVRFI